MLAPELHWATLPPSSPGLLPPPVPPLPLSPTWGSIAVAVRLMTLLLLAVLIGPVPIRGPIMVQMLVAHRGIGWGRLWVGPIPSKPLSILSGGIEIGLTLGFPEPAWLPIPILPDVTGHRVLPLGALAAWRTSSLPSASPGTAPHPRNTSPTIRRVQTDDTATTVNSLLPAVLLA